MSPHNSTQNLLWIISSCLFIELLDRIREPATAFSRDF